MTSKSTDKSSVSHIVFVYGTLKHGFTNHHLLENSLFISTGRTAKKYALYVQGIPFVVKHEPVSQIYGELYLVNSSTLAILDQLEGHPAWYRREQAEIITDNQVYTAWIYFYPTPTGKLIKTGRYEP
jgi:gamma-glutamylaminecyclotransferase